ncbi:predicted protein [Plenodomus lingam JN3]|uniref:Predicted protein n=1 Tax=Leptosphaeria maculans (strain JN3 / isolate v23.1.3 / race Av1-4-5-6-7-8) TaxID=985895 RepID=E4ZX01_LEPMJ|nr:predicted protein [Plenodomus lingam JN3]CBX95211.1 predicted protein [Plenodomus lingam JN3]
MNTFIGTVAIVVMHLPNGDIRGKSLMSMSHFVGYAFFGLVVNLYPTKRWRYKVFMACRAAAAISSCTISIVFLYDDSTNFLLTSASQTSTTSVTNLVAL